jgi:hypothetical protein
MERMFTHGGSGPSPSNAHRSASLREIDEKEEDGGGGGKLYVAVGKDLKDGRSNLLWAARSLLASDLKLVLLHVHQPAERIMTGKAIKLRLLQFDLNLIYNNSWRK